MKDYTVTCPVEAVAANPDIKVHGDPNAWICISKASSQSQRWMKSTKVMLIPHDGVLVQVSTQNGPNVTEALTFVGGVFLIEEEDGTYRLSGNPIETYVQDPLGGKDLKKPMIPGTIVKRAEYEQA